MADRDDSPGGSDDLDNLPPIKRDYGFLFKLIGALALGLVISAFVGMKLKGAAAGCGADLIRPGQTVIPPAQPPPPPQGAAPR